MGVLGLPSPVDAVRLTQQGAQAAAEAITLVPRLARIVTQGEWIVERIGVLLERVDQTQTAAADVVAGAAATAAAADLVAARAQTTVARAAQTTARAEELVVRLTDLLDSYQPVLAQLQPLLARLAQTTSQQEVDAAVRLIDTLPGVVDTVDADVLPILTTLATVAPDLRDLLDTSKALNEMLGALPGFGRVKKRVEQQQELSDDYRAKQEPPAAPDRSG